jgi:hypothetical protein
MEEDLDSDIQYYVHKTRGKKYENIRKWPKFPKPNGAQLEREHIAAISLSRSDGLEAP